MVINMAKRNKSRTYNSIINSMWGMASAIITVVLNFAVRIIIVKALGEEINGLHNLFQNTINVMALMETGISSAMIIHLYAPIKNNDKELIKKLISFYRRIYLYIAFAFFTVGILVNLFVLEHIISTTVSMKAVHIYFILFVLSFFANYLSYYKRSILYAEQNNRISIMSATISQVVFRGLAIISALITHDYYLFLIFLIVEKICSNAICNIYVNKNHPYLKNLRGVSLESKCKKAIFDTIKPLFINQTALTVQNSANSILISMLLGNISIVGYYGNYQLVISTVQLLFSQIGGAFTTSFGNLATEKNKMKMYDAYRKSCYIMNSLAIICCAGFVACIQDFIEFVFGPSFVLSIVAVMILALSMLVYLLDIPIISVQNAMGLHGSDAVLMVVQAVSAIILGYIMGGSFGMEGILLGLTIPTIIFTFIHKGIEMSRIAFGISAAKYLVGTGFDLIKGIVISLFVCFVCMKINFSFILLNIIVKGLIAIIISIFIIVITSIRNPYFNNTIQMVKGIFNKIISR